MSVANGATSAALPELQAEPAKYLKPAQVAAMLQVSPRTIYRIAASDPTFPMLKLAGAVRFPRERLERWLRQREQGRPR